ncbi:unannotated protein [freshwater metagenome]|uniref:Unannotated protein n=1 Tax=freshwater metagenome TaxID=449393 RepID=A0A6J6R8R3_9ZZZZ
MPPINYLGPPLFQHQIIDYFDSAKREPAEGIAVEVADFRICKIEALTKVSQWIVAI